MANTPAGFPYEITPGNRWLTWKGISSNHPTFAPSISFGTDATTRYMPLLDTTSSTRPFKLRMMKSTDSGVTWAEEDAAHNITIGQSTTGSTDTTNTATTGLTSFIRDHEVFAADYDAVNGIIYVVYFSAANTLTISPYTVGVGWGTPNDSGIEPEINPQNSGGILVAYRPISNTLWIFTGTTTLFDLISCGTNAFFQHLTRQPQVYAVKYDPAGLTWGSLTQFSNTFSGMFYAPIGIGIDANDRIQILMSKAQVGADGATSFDVVPGVGTLVHVDNTLVSAGGNSYNVDPATGVPNSMFSQWLSANGVIVYNPSEGYLTIAGGALTSFVNPGPDSDQNPAVKTLPWYQQLLPITTNPALVTQCLNPDDSFGSEVVVVSGDTYANGSHVRIVGSDMWITFITNSATINFATAPIGASPTWTVTAPTAFNPPSDPFTFPPVDIANVAGVPVAFISNYHDGTEVQVDYSYSNFNGSDWDTLVTYATDDESSEFAEFPPRSMCVYYPASGTTGVAFIYGTHFISIPGTAQSQQVGQAYWELGISPPPPVTKKPYAQYIKRFCAPGH